LKCKCQNNQHQTKRKQVIRSVCTYSHDWIGRRQDRLAELGRGFYLQTLLCGRPSAPKKKARARWQNICVRLNCNGSCGETIEYLSKVHCNAWSSTKRASSVTCEDPVGTGEGRPRPSYQSAFRSQHKLGQGDRVISKTSFMNLPPLTAPVAREQRAGSGTATHKSTGTLNRWVCTNVSCPIEVALHISRFDA
jgi:hypothetical protein